MKRDPTYDLQVAIVGRLKDFGDLTADLDGRVFDSVPRDGGGKVTAKFPYLSFGAEQVLPNGWDCQNGSEIYITLDTWSRAVGWPEVKRIAGAVRRALDDCDLPLADNALVSFEFDRMDLLHDPDGITRHAAITFRALVEHD